MKNNRDKPEAKTLRVLILEDSPADAELIQRELKRAGIAVTALLVEGKKQFSAALAGFRPQVILSDFKLPRFDGMAALNLARQSAPDTPFLFVSGSIGEEKAIETLALGASDYIFKDNLARLGPAVKRAVAAARLKAEKENADRESLRHADELRLLAEAADHFVHINDLDKIYTYLTQTIRTISGADYLLLSLYNEERQGLQPKVLEGVAPFQELLIRQLGRPPEETILLLKDMSPAEFADFISRKLLPSRDGLFTLTDRTAPRSVCRLIEKTMGISAIYSMGFSWENQLFGGLALAFKKDKELRNGHTIEAVVNLAAVAIKRLLAEKSLRESEERFRRISETISDISYSCLADANGEYAISWMTGAIDRITGYTIEEVIAMRCWKGLVLAEDHPDFDRYVTGLAPGNSGICELRLRHKKGSVVWVQSFAECSPTPGRPGPLMLFGGLMDISERKRIETALRESERKYRTLVNQSPDGIFIIDLQGNFLSVNQSMCAGLGFSEAEFLSMNFRDIIPEKFLDLHKKRLADIMQGRPQEEAAEYEARGKDGKSHYIAILSAPFYKDNRLIGFQGIARDITEKRKMETRLRESEEYYRTLVQTSPDAIIIVDAGGRVTFASQRTLEIFGIPAGASLAGVSILDFVEPEEIPRVQERMVEILSGHSQPEVREYRLRRRDGTAFWADISSAPLRDGAGRSIGLLLVCRDISARKRFATALQESEAKYRLIADNTAETITVLDLELNLTYVSPSILRLRGYTVEEVLRQSLPQIITPDSLAIIQQVLAEETALESSGEADPKRSRTLELQEYHRDGSVIWVENTISFLRNESGKPIGFLAVARDISERKHAENALRLSEEKFRKIFEEHSAVKLLIEPETGAILDANQAAVEYYGWTRDELKKMNVNHIHILPAADVPGAMRTAQEPKRAHFEFRHRRADGSIRDVEVFSGSIAIEGKDIIHSIIHDITERKHAEEQIAYQASLLQKVSDAIIATDKDNRIQMWNEAAERIYGWKAEEAIGKVFHDLIRPEYRYQHREEVTEKLSREGVWSGELVHNLRGGRRIPVQSTITLLKDAAGQLAGTVSVNHDISERKQAEEKLQDRDRLLHNLSAQVPGMIYTFQRRPDGTYGIPYSSSAIQGIFGVSPQEVIHDASAIFRPMLPEDQPRVVALIEESARTLSPWRAEYRVQLPGQPIRWMLGQSDPVRLADGSVLWYGFNTDITERKHAEDLIRASLREKEVLLQEIHHRVKNNLQVISGLLTLQADQAAGKSVNEIFRESQDRIRSIALIHEKLYRSHNLAEIPFDDYLRALTENLFTSHGVTAGRVRARFDMEKILFTIEKAIPLGLIVNELVTNSLKHAFPSGKQGEIRIGLHGYGEAKSFALKTDSGTLHVVPTCELVVADDGVGLPAGTTLAKQKTLGMQLVSMLARQLQAEFKLKTGPGTEFRLIFPGTPTAAEEQNPKGGA